MNTSKSFAVLLYFVFSIFSGQAQNQKISLNSSNHIKWELKPMAEIPENGSTVSTPGFKMKDYVAGVVPGIVFTAYVEAGKEKEPNFSDNIWKVNESFYNRPFWYRAEFETPKDIKEGQKIWLQFDNTNRYADFYFNGKKISGTETSTKDVSGHMLRSKFDITALVNKSGKNAVAVLIYDANQKKTRDAEDRFGITASPTYLAAAGWDWMPYVPGRLAGITGNAYIEITGDVRMEDPWIRTELESNDVAYLDFQTALKNTSSQKKEAVVTVKIQPGDITVSNKITIAAGSTEKIYMNRKQFKELIMLKPKLWWPNGYGDPNLYTCQVEVKVDGNTVDEKEIKFGIKKYEYRFENNVAGWPVMTFYINGQKIFLKGGNWGMSEYLLRTHGEEYEKKVKLHKDMNYNMIRLWTGCVTDDEFYDYCDKYGIMVWDDFWLYVAYNAVEDREVFKQNALDKVRRLRNHASIALWCGANETHPEPELDDYLRGIVGSEDHNDRMYKSSSNQDGLSGSGWWGNQPPKHHFESSGSNLAWNNPPYPYGSDRGYGLRSEIGTTTFPVYESIQKFIDKKDLWPLPTEEQLKNEDNVWSKHYFGKEASNANPINYLNAVNNQFGKSSNLSEFAEKAQLINIEVMKGMYEAWNDKMWNDASGMLIWMSQSAYPSFVWQTYDYYYDATGAYWGTKKACEPLHIQWNSSSNSVKVINTTSKDLKDASAKATIYNLKGEVVSTYTKEIKVDVKSSNIKEAFKLNFNPENLATGKKVTASSERQSGSFTVDGGSGSRWESDYSDNQWIVLDLEENKTIQKMILKWEVAYAKAYEMQISTDAENWKTIYSTTESDGGVDKITLEKPVIARYIRMYGKKRATEFGYSIYEIEVTGQNKSDDTLTPLHFIRLELNDNDGKLLSDNFYWRNGDKDLDYTDLNTLPKADVSYELMEKSVKQDSLQLRFKIKNKGKTVAFGNRLRLVNKTTGERILPLMMPENYFTLMPGEEKTITVSTAGKDIKGKIQLLVKQYGKEEESKLDFKF